MNRQSVCVWEKESDWKSHRKQHHIVPPSWTPVERRTWTQKNKKNKTVQNRAKDAYNFSDIRFILNFTMHQSAYYFRRFAKRTSTSLLSSSSSSSVTVVAFFIFRRIYVVLLKQQRQWCCRFYVACVFLRVLLLSSCIPILVCKILRAHTFYMPRLYSTLALVPHSSGKTAHFYESDA